MIPFGECPICGGKVARKTVEKLLKGGNNIARAEVEAEVCLRCGERLYAEETVRLFEEIREKLSRGEVESFKRLGRSFEVV